MVKGFLAAVLLLTLPSASIAQDRVSAQSPSIDVSIEGPAWVGTAETSLQTGASGAGNPVTISEFIPAGQSFDLWQELFAIMIEENVGLNLDQIREQHIGRYVGACDRGPEHTHIFETDPSHTIFLIPCGAYKASPETGEVLLMLLASAGPHLVKIYHHFRGPAFNPLDMESWPGSVEQMDAFLDNLRRMQVIEH